MKISDPHFERLYNKKLLKQLKKKFGPSEHHHVNLTITSQGMLDLMDKMSRKKRRGEVVMVIPNKKGHIWLHTKSFYDKGVYRLMTGGLDQGESPHLALYREAREETGFKIKIDRCLAVITYTLSGLDSSQPFVSYVFLTKPLSGIPRPIDDSEDISDFKAVPATQLADVAQDLHSLEGSSADWGKFRAVAHEIIHRHLSNK